MLFNWLFDILVTLVVSLDQALIPSLPSGFSTVWNTMLQYLGTGFRFIAVTFDVSLLRQLISWWIALGALVLSVEVFYGIWKKITGNAGREAESVTTTFDANGEFAGAKVKQTRSRNRLPRL